MSKHRIDWQREMDYGAAREIGKRSATYRYWKAHLVEAAVAALAAAVVLLAVWGVSKMTAGQRHTWELSGAALSLGVIVAFFVIYRQTRSYLNWVALAVSCAVITAVSYGVAAAFIMGAL